MISKDSLERLFRNCERCGSTILDLKYRVRGFELYVDYTCQNGHLVQWTSSATYHRTAQSNVVVPASFMLNGQGFEALNSVSKTLKMLSISGHSYYNSLKKFVYPTIYRKFCSMQIRVLTHVKTLGELTISGDCQFDSPGYCAK